MSRPFARSRPPGVPGVPAGLSAHVLLAALVAHALLAGCSADPGADPSADPSAAPEAATAALKQSLDNSLDLDNPGDSPEAAGSMTEESSYDADQVELQYTGQDLQAAEDAAPAPISSGGASSAVASSDIRVRGRIACTYRQPEDPAAYPLPFASIVAKDNNALAVDPVLATGFTDATGAFELTIPASKGDQAPDAPDIYLEVHYTDQYRRAAIGDTRRVYTTSSVERDDSIRLNGYLSEGIAGHVYVPPASGLLAQCPF